MNPLLAVGLGWFVLRALGDKGGAAAAPSKPAPRVIDASGPSIKLLPAKVKPPTGKVTVGPPTVVKSPGAKPVPPAPARTPQQAAQPAKPTAAPLPTARTAAATTAAREAMPQLPAAAQARPAAPPGTDLAKAKRIAPNIVANLKKQGRDKYDRAQLKSFQTAAGLTPDGIYGPVAKSALSYFGQSAPSPFFKGQDLKYVPPQGA